ncbi:hypothetical protein G4B88_030380 [Cannabis sativa]|uniref:C2H2-type domain-containing protein n=1 Tax=Cannabis sativa TaxID=3483 RepID=A0A7J6DUS0_CANSA|nr:hypothetical protein G4B88_030380 [Cannabis sativa]
MIKRRFYKMDHGDKNDEVTDDSSSSSDSEVEAQSQSDDDVDGVSLEQLKGDDAEACSTSSGYETEDSSANELGIDSSGLPIDEEDSDSGNERPNRIDSQLSDNELDLAGFPECVLKSKSVFKCKLCPRIVCLNEESLKAHLKSKRHSRSEKLLNEGRLKSMLNSDGEIDNEDLPAKQHEEAEPPSQDKPKREKRGRQRQRRRLQNKRSKQMNLILVIKNLSQQERSRGRRGVNMTSERCYLAAKQEYAYCEKWYGDMTSSFSFVGWSDVVSVLCFGVFKVVCPILSSDEG